MGTATYLNSREDAARAALEQQRDDIQAVLKEIARFERQCREMLKAEEPAAPTVRQPKRRTSGSG